MRRLLGSLALGALLLTAGCGQKGPLYLPDKNVRVITTPQGQSGSPQHPQAEPAPVQPAPAQPPPEQSGASPPSGAPPQSAPPSTTPANSAPPKAKDQTGDSQAPTQP